MYRIDKPGDCNKLGFTTGLYELLLAITVCMLINGGWTATPLMPHELSMPRGCHMQLINTHHLHIQQ